MTFEEDIRNMKGRIREAMYAGKNISFFTDFLKYYTLCTGGERCTSTYFFASYINASRFYVYFRPNMPFMKRKELLVELKKYIQESGGCFYDI